MSRLDRYLGRSFLLALLLGQLPLLVATWVLPGLQGLTRFQRLGLHHFALPLLSLAAAFVMALQLRSREEWTGLLCQGHPPWRLFRIVPLLSLLVWILGSWLPPPGQTDTTLEARFLHLDAANAFSGSRGIISYEKRRKSRLLGVLYLRHGKRPESYDSVDIEMDTEDHLRFRYAGELLPDLDIRPSRPDRELRRRILGRPPLQSLFSWEGLPYHGLHLLLSLLLPLMTLSLAVRYGLPVGTLQGYLLPILIPATLLLVVFLLLALQASSLLL